MTLSGLKKTGTSERVDIRHGPVPNAKPQACLTKVANPITSYRTYLACFCFLQAAIPSGLDSGRLQRLSRYLV